MKTRIKEQGSIVHIVIIVVLVVGLLGALGFVFWQNFIQKKSDDQSKVDTTSKATSAAIVKDKATELPATAAPTDANAAAATATKGTISAWMTSNASVDITSVMADTVNYAIAYSDGIMKGAPKAKVAANMGSYLQGRTKPWVSTDFSATTGQAAFQKQANADTYFDFEGSYVSLNTGSDSQDFAAFKLNDKGLISDVYLGTVLEYNT